MLLIYFPPLQKSSSFSIEPVSDNHSQIHARLARPSGHGIVMGWSWGKVQVWSTSKNGIVNMETILTSIFSIEAY